MKDKLYIGDFDGDGMSDILIDRWRTWLPGWCDIPPIRKRYLYVALSNGLSAPSEPVLWGETMMGGRILIGNYDGDSYNRDDVAIARERRNPQEPSLDTTILQRHVAVSTGDGFEPFEEWDEQFGYGGDSLF